MPVKYLNPSNLLNNGDDKMQIKAKFQDGYFIPLRRIKLNDGEIVELDLVPQKKFSWKGALKNIKSTSVELQHKIKESW